MTPSQLDHLRALDAHLANLLDIAAKRTPGRWVFTEAGCANGGLTCDIIDDGDFASSSAEVRRPDASFIAACAGNAEAGWESTRKIIQEALFLHSDAPGELGSVLQIILAQWPLELLATAKV